MEFVKWGCYASSKSGKADATIYEHLHCPDWHEQLRRCQQRCPPTHHGMSAYFEVVVHWQDELPQWASTTT